MRWLGTGMVGAAGLAVLFGSGPFGLEGALADGQFTLLMGVLAATWWLTWAAIAAAVVMRLDSPLDPRTVAVRAALGESSSARIAAAIRGALLGGAAAGAAVFVVGAVLALRDVDGREGAPWGWVIAVSLTTTAAVLAASAGAAWAKPAAPLGDVLRGSDEIAPPSRRTSLTILLVAAAFGLGALAVAIFADTGAAGAVAGLGCGFALVWGAWEWMARGGTEFAPVVLARVARRLGARAGQVGALLSDEALARQRLRGGVVIGAISFLAMVTAMSADATDPTALAIPLPALVIDNVRATDGAACVGACLEGFGREIGGFPAVAAAIPAVRGNLVGDGCSGALLAVDPSVVRAFSSELARELEGEQEFSSADSTVCGQSFRGSAAESRPTPANAFEPNLVNSAHASSSSAAPDALLIYPASGDRVGSVAAVARAAEDSGVMFSTVYSWDTRPPYATARFAWIFPALLVGLLLIPLGALLTSAVAERRRHHMTLAALGASRASLRWAIGIDAAVRAWLAVLAGLAAGVAVRVVWALFGSVGGPAESGYVARLAASLENVAWLQIGIFAVVAFGLAALMSLPAALSLPRLTPAEALRSDRKGVAS